MKNNKTGVILLSFFILLSAVFITYSYYMTKDQKKPLPVLGNPGHKVAEFSFVNQDGKVITNKDVKGKVCVIEYFFTTCKGICPKMNENMTQVYKAFRGNNKVVILSHTVDPKKDTVKAMKEYSQRFDADASQWMFLTGDKKELYDMARYSYLINALDDTTGVSIDKDFIHDNHYMLVDGDGRIRGAYDGLKKDEITKMIQDINTLLKETD